MQIPIDLASYMSRLGLPGAFFASNRSSDPGLRETLDGPQAASSSPTFPNLGGGIMDSFIATAGRASPIAQLALFLYRQLGSSLGIDPSVIITTLGVAWAVFKIISQLYGYGRIILNRYFRSFVQINGSDEIYNQIMDWLAKHPSTHDSRQLSAQTGWSSAWDEKSRSFWGTGGGMEYTELAQDGGPRYLNFSNAAIKAVPRYFPAVGISYFWHKGTYFTLSRTKDEPSVNINRGRDAMRDREHEELVIYCYGRSAKPIKSLLAEAKANYFADSSQTTEIYRPNAKDNRFQGRPMMSARWYTAAKRPIRPMQTVVLDPAQKKYVMGDINEYLHPSTRDWYAERGIPLRRGYLFHGPPGTGKTSFSFALAGIFGINIYVISLQDPALTEEDLTMLFTTLPSRCIVLLEDVDTAGIRRRDESEDEDDAAAENPAKHEIRSESGRESRKLQGKTSPKVGSTNETEPSKSMIYNSRRGMSSDGKSKALDKTTANGTEEGEENELELKSGKAPQPPGEGKSEKDVEPEEGGRNPQQLSIFNLIEAINGKKEESQKVEKRRPPTRLNPGNDSPTGISLSGLLNAIDGVASHEGRVLIMTTNKPESLDEALIRPGRVDIQVAFSNASRQQAGELFRRMYDGVTVLDDNQKENSDAGDHTYGTASREAQQLQPQQQQQQQQQNVSGIERRAKTRGKLSENAELDEIAERFGKLFPEELLSPAEIQGFLLKRKRDPRKALEQAPEWIETMVKQKQDKKKVKTVQ